MGRVNNRMEFFDDKGNYVYVGSEKKVYRTLVLRDESG
jgi:hypothetical protein